jgi:RNA polymerase sigma-70 factor, ECF subfamily
MANQMDEDIQYIDQFLEGQIKGFEALVRKYQNRVLNIVYSLIGRDQESEDIMQEVFMKVYHHLEGFKKSSQFLTWLYRITVNTTYDFLRKRKYLVNDEEQLALSASNMPGPREDLLIREKEAIIQKALGKIPLKFRAAVVLKDIEDLSYQQIAEVLHCRIGTVESKIYRARQCLKAELLKSEGESR